MKKFSSVIVASLITAAVFSGCKAKVKINNDYDETLTTVKQCNIDTQSECSAFELSLKTGNITVTPTDKDVPTMNLECTVFADNEDTCKDVSEHISTVIMEKDGNLKLAITEKETGQEIEKWIEDTETKARVEFNAEIGIPASYTTVDADVQIGNITFDGITGELLAYANVGNITCTGSTFTEDSYIECNTGNISCSKCTWNSTNLIKVDTGNIIFGLPNEDSVNGDLAIEVRKGNLTFDNGSEYKIEGDPDKGNAKLTKSGCSINAAVISGKLNLDKE